LNHSEGVRESLCVNTLLVARAVRFHLSLIPIEGDHQMNIDLPADQAAFIEHLVATGRYASLNEAIRDGVRLLISQERLKQQVSVGIEQANRGELVDHDTVFGQLKAMAATATQPESGE
jgi:antitoxin ParD1/3/4